MKILNIPFGDTIMTKLYKTRIRSLLVIGLLAAVVFGQQTAMAQVQFHEGYYTNLNSPGSLLHGRNGAVANAIMSELGIISSLKRYRSGIPYGVATQRIDSSYYNQVTNLAQLSGITSLHIHGVMRPLDDRSWYSTERYSISYFRSFSSSDFIGLTNLHTLNLSSVRVSSPRISYSSQLRRSNQGLSFDLDAFENLPNLRTLIVDNEAISEVSQDRLFSLKPLLDFQFSRLVSAGRSWYREVVTPVSRYPTGNVDSPGSFFHGRPKSVTRSILSALADANTDITHYNQVTNVAQLRDIEEMTLYINIDHNYGFNAVTELNSLISAEVFDNLVNLRTLNLRVDGLTSLPAGIFDNLVNLQSLDLSHNRLTSLPSRLFDNLVNLDPAVLRGLLAPIIQVSPATLRSYVVNDPRYEHETTPNGFKITEGQKVPYLIASAHIPSNLGNTTFMIMESREPSFLKYL